MGNRGVDLPDLPLEWFVNNCFADASPIDAYKTWWKNEHRWSGRTKYKKVLQLTSGLTEGSIRNYLNGDFDHLGAQKTLDMDNLLRKLDHPLPAPDKVRRKPRRRKRSRELALVTELSDLPSSMYHHEIMNGIFREAALHHYSVNVYEVKKEGYDLVTVRDHGREDHSLIIAQDYDSVIERIVHIFRPRGVIGLRLNPLSKGSCAALIRENIPIISIHADPMEYQSPPVLANIVPDQSQLGEDTKRWVNNLLEKTSDKKIEVILVKMPDEPGDSIRNDRIKKIETALQECVGEHPECLIADTTTVRDYSFRHALSVYNKYLDATGFLCLCDPIAISLAHLLEAAGEEYQHRVVGFDNSELAKKENISSFDQSLDQIGERVIERFTEWFEQRNPTWPECPEELKMEVSLVMRN